MLLEELLTGSQYEWLLQHVRLRDSLHQNDAHSLTLTTGLSDRGSHTKRQPNQRKVSHACGAVAAVTSQAASSQPCAAVGVSDAMPTAASASAWLDGIGLDSARNNVSDDCSRSGLEAQRLDGAGGNEDDASVPCTAARSSASTDSAGVTAPAGSTRQASAPMPHWLSVDSSLPPQPQRPAPSSRTLPRGDVWGLKVVVTHPYDEEDTGYLTLRQGEQLRLECLQPEEGQRDKDKFPRYVYGIRCGGDEADGWFPYDESVLRPC